MTIKMTVRATALTTNLHVVLPIYHQKLALPCGWLVMKTREE